MKATPEAARLPDECKSADRVPGEILQRLAAQPSGGLYYQLGIEFGRKGDYGCATAAFDAAVALDPTATEARYNLALALIQNHDPQRAAQELRSLIQEQPKAFAAHNALGLALQDLHQSEEASQEFKIAISINPNFALAYYDLAQLLTSQGSHKAAAYYLEQGLSVSPTPQLALQMKTALGVVRAQLGDYAAAIPLFQEAAAANPDSAELHYDLATAYAHRENYIDAVREYKEVVRIDPSRIDAELLLAKALLNQSAVEECLPYLRNYLQRRPEDAEALEILGDALKQSSSHLNEAVEVLQHAVSVDPSSYKSHYDLGVVLGRLNRLDDAIHELQIAAKLKPEGSEARYQLALLLAKAGRQSAAKEQFATFDQLKQQEQKQTRAVFLASRAGDLLREKRDQEAIAAYRQALLTLSSDPELHYNLAIALGRAGDHVDEQRELEMAVHLDPKFSQARNELGALHLRQNHLTQAEQQFRAALDSNPQAVDSLNNLGTVLVRQGRNEEAENLFRRAVELDPGSPLGFLNLGLTLASMKNYPKAESGFRHALSLDPNNVDALTALGMVLGKTGRSTESIENFRRVTALNPSSADAHLNLGIALADGNDLEGALVEFSEAVQHSPDSAPAHYNRGRVLYALHRNEAARESLETAVKLSPNYVDALMLLGVIEHTSSRATEIFQRVTELEPDNAQAHFYLGRNLSQQGRKEEAITQWKTAVALDPDNVSALSSLARVLTQDKSSEAGDYASRLQAQQQKQHITDRVKELNNFALRAAEEQKWDQAVGQLQEAIKLCEQCVQLGVLRKNIGLIYARKGDAERAREELQIALRLLPSGPDAIAAEQALQQLQQAPAGSLH